MPKLMPRAPEPPIDLVERRANGTFAPGHAPHPKAGRPLKRRIVEVAPSNFGGCMWGFGGLDGISSATDHELLLAERSTANSFSSLLLAMESVLSEMVRVRFELARRNPDAARRVGSVISRIGDATAAALNEAVAEGAYGHRLKFLEFVPGSPKGPGTVEAVLGLPDGPLDELDHELASILREVEAQQAAAEAERADRLNVSTAAFRDSVAQTAEETDHERA